MGSRTELTNVKSIVRIIGLALIVLLIFGLTVLLIALKLAWIRSTPISGTWILATICALILWLFVAVFHIRRETVTVSFRDRRQFLDTIKTQLADLGFELKREDEREVVFKPTFHARVIGGGVLVELDIANARITGPKVYVERLQKRLRNQSFLGSLQKSLAEAQSIEENRKAVR